MKTADKPGIEHKLDSSQHKRVICIDATKIRKDYQYPRGKIRKGQVYHVTGMNRAPDGLGLEILGKPVLDGRKEASWKAERFRVVG